jgi:rhodanese-related sulfurtransferase
MNKNFFRYVSAACLMAALCVNIHAQPSAAPLQATSTPPADAAIPAAQLLQPEVLVQLLRSPGKEKPLILQVGSHVLYAEAHIPGSEYVGAAGQDSGLQTLRNRVKGLKRDQLLVIYCGCCPWNKCPNIRPAYRQLRALGFIRVKVLYLADNFGTNWVDKGYPVTKGR